MIGIVHMLDGKFNIHSEYKKEITPALIKKAAGISRLIDQTFKSKGVNTLHTWAQTKDEMKYNEFLGFKRTGLKILKESFGGPLPDDYPLDVYEYSKELI